LPSDNRNFYSRSGADPNLPLVVVNPTSAGGETARFWARAASDLSNHFGVFAVEFTRTRGDGKRIALEAARNGRKFIIACGGDGTINEVANGILEAQTETELGILPSGTGGDFRRTLLIPASSRRAAQVLRDGKTITIDVGRVTFVNHRGDDESRFFLGVSSLGLSTSVVDRVKRNKPFAWLPVRGLAGQAGFAWSTLQSTLAMKYTNVRVAVDDARERNLSVVNFCVANARYFGGGMKIAPDARLDDGQFDVVVIGEIRSSKILANSYKLYVGTHNDLTEVHQTRASKIVIQPASENEIVPIEIDGELPGRLPAKFEIVPQALKIRVPPNF
jgi:diacylglycerol kinase (ATP)